MSYRYSEFLPNGAKKTVLCGSSWDCFVIFNPHISMVLSENEKDIVEVINLDGDGPLTKEEYDKLIEYEKRGILVFTSVGEFEHQGLKDIVPREVPVEQYTRELEEVLCNIQLR